MDGGDDNTVIGQNAMGNLLSGGANIVIGKEAGIDQTGGNNNIIIGHPGTRGTASTTILIGNPGLKFRTFIAGIRGTTTGENDAVDVVIDSNGQLGTVNSSRRFKEDIHDMGSASHRLLALRPVTYRYKEAYTDGTKPIQYGLIAEEVAEVYPDLVVYDKDGQVRTIQYRKLVPMLLNEWKREHHLNLQQTKQIGDLKAQLTVVKTQHRQLKEVMARVARLELLNATSNHVVVQTSHHK